MSKAGNLSGSQAVHVPVDYIASYFMDPTNYHVLQQKRRK